MAHVGLSPFLFGSGSPGTKLSVAHLPLNCCCRLFAAAAVLLLLLLPLCCVLPVPGCGVRAEAAAAPGGVDTRGRLPAQLLYHRRPGVCPALLAAVGGEGVGVCCLLLVVCGSTAGRAWRCWAAEGRGGEGGRCWVGVLAGRAGACTIFSWLLLQEVCELGIVWSAGRRKRAQGDGVSAAAGLASALCAGSGHRSLN